MKYNCPECEFSVEGDSKITKLILDHERTHPKKTTDVVDDGTKPPCSFCGCDVEHESEDKKSVKPLDLCGIPFKHITYDEVAYTEVT